MKLLLKMSSVIKFVMVLSIAMAALQPKKAEAGVAIGFGGVGMGEGPNGVSHRTEVIADIMFGAGTAMVIGSVVVNIVTGYDGAGLLLMAALEADGSLPKNVLVDSLSTQYPFIDNKAVINELAEHINTKFKNLKTEDASPVLVSLSAAETEEILAPAGLSSEQLEQIVKELM